MWMWCLHLLELLKAASYGWFEILTSLLTTSELGQTYLMIEYVLKVELCIVGSNKLPRINSVESKRRVPPGLTSRCSSVPAEVTGSKFIWYLRENFCQV